MKSIDEAEAQARLDGVLDEAQRQPIAIRREDREIAIVLSVAEYERLRVAAISDSSRSATASPARPAPLA